VDWWSFGILTHDMLTGAPPFTGNIAYFGSGSTFDAGYAFECLLDLDPEGLKSEHGWKCKNDIKKIKSDFAKTKKNIFCVINL
jgi:serine/threonine protein kinase